MKTARRRFMVPIPKVHDLSPGNARRKRPPRDRDPQNPDQTWSGVGRSPKWVQAILDERGIDMAAFKSIPMYRIHSSSRGNERAGDRVGAGGG